MWSMARFRLRGVARFGVAEDAVEGGAGVEEAVEEGVSRDGAFGGYFVVEGVIVVEESIGEDGVEIDEAFVC